MSSGSSIQAEAYRNAAQAVYGAARFNIGIVNVNESRKLADIAIAIPRTLSTQRAQAGSSGLAVSSKSFNMITTETLDTFLRKANQLRDDAEYERKRIWYEAQVRATNLENQARAAEYAGQVQRGQMIGSLFKGIARLF